MSELLPCPFCGEAIRVLPFLNRSGQINGHPFNDCLLSGCHIADDKAAAWNTRHTPTLSAQVPEDEGE